jgi:hypothetical protein
MSRDKVILARTLDESFLHMSSQFNSVSQLVMMMTHVGDSSKK